MHSSPAQRTASALCGPRTSILHTYCSAQSISPKIYLQKYKERVENEPMTPQILNPFIILKAALGISWAKHILGDILYTLNKVLIRKPALREAFNFPGCGN